MSDVSALSSFLETSEFAALRERQSEYRAFVRSFRGDNGGFDAHELHAVTQIALGELRVSVISINSALLAEGGPEDHGRMQVSVRDLESVCADVRKGNHLVFALMHHPFDWLATFESDRTEGLVFDTADILLRGHLHQPKSGSQRGGIVSAVGAAWEKNAGDYEYGFGAISPKSMKCEIECVRYVQQTGKWMHDAEEFTLVRSRDDRATPGVIRAALLGHGLKFPAQIASVLAGYANELLTRTTAGPAYLSTERLLAQAVRNEAENIPALGVVHIANLITFFGLGHISSIVKTELRELANYDNSLQTAAATNPGLAEEIRAREFAANRLSDLVEEPQPWSAKLLARLVAEGDRVQIAAMRGETESLLCRVQDSLAAGKRDTYEAWLDVRGPNLDFAELAILATRLAVKATADLASLALLDAASRFPKECGPLDEIARIIAIELSDSRVYTNFKKAASA